MRELEKFLYILTENLNYIRRGRRGRRSLYTLRSFSTAEENLCIKFFCFSFFFRSSRPEVYCKKDVLGNFAKFTGKHLYQRLFNKVAALWSETLLKKRLWHRCFPLNFVKFLKHLFCRTPLDNYFYCV